MEFENLQIEIPTEEDPAQSQLFGIKIHEKKYHNKNKDFVVGFNPKSKEFVERKSRRAKRFGIEKDSAATGDGNEEVTSPVTDTSEFVKIDLNILKWPPVPTEAYEEIRSTAILVYGVQDMSTKDVFQYFKLYGPESLEWIDDFSCNVVWEEEKSVMEAMDNLSKTYTMLSRLKQTQGSGNDTTSVVNEPITVKDEIDNDEIEEISSNTVLIEDQEINPKEIWRIALPWKTSELYFRPATIKDKKLPGAAERSEYYLKYGKNENATKLGSGGVISKSRKRKLERMRQTAEDRFKTSEPDVKLVDIPDTKKEENKMEVDDDEPQVKRLNVHDNRANQMSMVADKVEIRQRLGARYNDETVHNRLGNPFLKSRGEDSAGSENDDSPRDSNVHRRLGSGIRDRLGGFNNTKQNNGPDVRREIESSRQNKNHKNMLSHGYEEDGVYHDIYRANDIKIETKENITTYKRDIDSDSHRTRSNMKERVGVIATADDSPVSDLRNKLKNKGKTEKVKSKKSIRIEPSEKLNLCIEIKQELSDVEMPDGDFEF